MAREVRQKTVPGAVVAVVEEAAAPIRPVPGAVSQTYGREERSRHFFPKQSKQRCHSFLRLQAKRSTGLFLSYERRAASIWSSVEGGYGIEADGVVRV
jgi:hypothetical protein